MGSQRSFLFLPVLRLGAPRDRKSLEKKQLMSAPPVISGRHSLNRIQFDPTLDGHQSFEADSELGRLILLTQIRF